MTPADGRLPLMASYSTDSLTALIEHSHSDVICTRAQAEQMRRMAALRWGDTQGRCARRVRDLRDAIGHSDGYGRAA